MSLAHTSKPRSNLSLGTLLLSFLFPWVGSPLVVGGSGLVHGDTVVLTSGRTLEGKVLERSAEGIVVELSSGATVRIPGPQVLEVRPGPTPREELARREAELPPGDAAASFELARWCQDRHLAGESRRLLWKALELDPHHGAAWEELGFRRLGALWLSEDDYQRALGHMRFEDRWVTPREYMALAQREAGQQRLTQAEELLRRAAGRDPDEARAAALAEFRALPATVRRYALARGLDSARTRLRQFAVRELGASAERGQHTRLAHLAVADGMRSVRDEALRVLHEWARPDTALSFLPYLSAPDQRQRIHAARALNVFPDRRAVGPLIERASKIWAGFGRAHIVNVVQRAYVKDYELVSGGTGLVVQEVADPVIDTFQVGVVLDIDVTRVEAVSLIATLERTTGQTFGMDLDAWRSWWARESGRAAPAAATPPTRGGDSATSPGGTTATIE